MPDLIYFDQAATSFPKPQAVIEGVSRSLADGSASPGRSAHQMSLAASRTVFAAREAVADLFGVDDSSRIAFTLNVTMAVNTALAGFLNPGDHVLTTSMEHNSVMRPLNRLARVRGIEVEVIAGDREGIVDPAEFGKRVRPATRLAVVNHASNVVGTVVSLPEVKAALGGVPLLVDAAQTAGILPLSPAPEYADVIAFTGHKGLLGPTGTGGLWVRPGLDIGSLVQGGTGSRSEHEEHPDFMPDMLEAGTPNTHGLAGLAAGVGFVLDIGPDRIHRHEVELTETFIAGISGIEGLRMYGPSNSPHRTGVVSINLDGWSPSDLARALDRDHGIMTRAGLHCAPRAHRTIGTYPSGTVRFSFGWFNTPREVERTTAALSELSRTEP